MLKQIDMSSVGQGQLQQRTEASTAAEILGTAYKYSGGLASSVGSYSAPYVAYASSPETGSYTLNVLFYMLLYAFVLFIILIIVHFIITPVFIFKVGGKGLFKVPTAKDSLVYWNAKKQPLPTYFAPTVKAGSNAGDANTEGAKAACAAAVDAAAANPDATPGNPAAISDALATTVFDKNFSFCIDVFVRSSNNNISGNSDIVSKSRVILYKTYDFTNITGGSASASGVPAGSTTPKIEAVADPATGTYETIEEYMKTVCSMYMYLTPANDLIVTFFSGPTGTAYSCRPIKNIPLYTPFRISVVVEEKTFTVYINAKQAFQRVLPGSITINNKVAQKSTYQVFYPKPSWVDSSIFLQNFQLWPRAISLSEVETAQPALALVSDFNMPGEKGSSTTAKCETDRK